MTYTILRTDNNGLPVSVFGTVSPDTLEFSPLAVLRIKKQTASDDLPMDAGVKMQIQAIHTLMADEDPRKKSLKKLFDSNSSGRDLQQALNLKYTLLERVLLEELNSGNEHPINKGNQSAIVYSILERKKATYNNVSLSTKDENGNPVSGEDFAIDRFIARMIDAESDFQVTHVGYNYASEIYPLARAVVKPEAIDTFSPKILAALHRLNAFESENAALQVGNLITKLKGPQNPDGAPSLPGGK